MILKLSLDLPDDEKHVPVVRRLARALLRDLNVESEDIDNVELILGELCGNVARHARSDAGLYRLGAVFYHDRVALSVRDRGPGFPFADVPRVGTVRPDTLHGGTRIGGYGLFLVKQLSDHVEFERTDSKGTTVRAEVRLRYSSPAAARKAAILDSSRSGSRPPDPNVS